MKRWKTMKNDHISSVDNVEVISEWIACGKWPIYYRKSTDHKFFKTYASTPFTSFIKWMAEKKKTVLLNMASKIDSFHFFYFEAKMPCSMRTLHFTP